MQMYTQKIKECDHAFNSECVDLSEMGNYLVLPNKFLTRTQEIQKKNNRIRVKIIYSIDKKLLENPLVRLKQKNRPIDCFFVVYPSGRVEQWHIQQAIYKRKNNALLKKYENRLYIYLESPKRITVELVDGSLNEISKYFQKNIILGRLNSRNLQLKERSKPIEKSSNRLSNDFTILHNAFADG